MPRKTDGILFELHPRPTKGDDGKPLLYAQPVIEYKYDLDAIDDYPLHLKEELCLPITIHHYQKRPISSLRL